MSRLSERKTYHHGDLRRGLMDAALALLAEKGIHALSIREAAKRAGVSSGAPYRHFPAKESLLAALAVEGFHDLGERLISARDRWPADPRRQLQASAEAYVGFALEHPERFRLMFGGFFPDTAEYPELLDACAVAEGVLFDMIRGGQEAGVVSGHPVDNLATVTHAFLHGLTSLLIEGHLAIPAGLSLEAWLTPLFEACWTGLSAPGG